MDDFARSDYRGFSNPADRTMWAWIAGAAIVAVVMTFLATAGVQHPQLAANIPATAEPALIPPITQSTPVKPTDIEAGPQ